MFKPMFISAVVTAGVLVQLLSATTEAQAAQLSQNGVTETTPSSTTGETSGTSGSSPASAPAAPHAEVKSAYEQVGGSSWISQQPAGNYTLQLMVALSPKQLLAFARKKSLAGPLAVAAFRRDNKELYLLLQGSYTSRNEAESVAATFNQETGERPWVRKFSSLPELFDSSSPPPRHAVAVSKPPIKVMAAAWLWSRNPVRYTIQLMADRRAESLRAFIAEQGPAGPVAIVRVVRKGSPWYLLLVGDFATQEEAVAAINALPEGTSARGPWPRRFSSLQDQMVAGNH